MCVNYQPPGAARFHAAIGNQGPVPADWQWPEETWKDYLAPIVRARAGREVEALVGSYGMVPQRHLAPGSKSFDTMNARGESLAERRSFSSAWQRAQLCAVPMHCFYEPCYESGHAERYAIGMHDDALFWVAGLWRDWVEADGLPSTSFTQITINADSHPLMRRMHRPGDEKRSLVILPEHSVRAWLACRSAQQALALLRDYPAEAMKAWPAPRTLQRSSAAPDNGELF